MARLQILRTTFANRLSVRRSRAAHVRQSEFESLECRDLLAANIVGATWYDADGDGIRSSREAALAGVAIELHHAAGALAVATTTDYGGAYRFDDVPAGDYYVELTAPEGQRLSPFAAGNDVSIDSDFDPATARTNVFSVTDESTVAADGGLFALPDLMATSLDWGAIPGSVSFEYAIAGKLTVATSLNVYWASGFTADKRLGEAVFSHAIAAEDLSGRYGPIVAAIDATSKPPNATHLILVADAANLVAEFNEQNNTQSLELANLSAVVRDTSTFDGFYWNSLEAGGGFTFHYDVVNPSSQLLETEIDFRWNGSPSTPAYHFAINAASVDSDARSAMAPGRHRLTVTQSQLVSYAAIAANGSTASPPHAIGFGGQADTLVAVIDPVRIDRPNGSVAEARETDNAASVVVTPLVVSVVTHGFNPLGFGGNDAQFLAPFHSIGDRLQSMPATASTLDHRVAEYVADWDSTTAFLGGFLSLFAAKAVLADVELLNRNGSPPADLIEDLVELADALRNGATAAAIYADPLLGVAATRIVEDLMANSALTPAINDQLQQRVLLVGHSRGAAVNAIVAQLLVERGGFDPQQIEYVALDGYGSDWTHDGGILSTFDVGVESDDAATRINYRAAQGLAFDPTVLDLLGALLPAELLQQLQADEQDTLLAPHRENFTSNAVLPDLPIDLQFPGGSFHTTIAASYANGAIAAGDTQPAIEDNFIGQHAGDGLTAAAAAQTQSQRPSSQQAAARSDAIGNISTGFADGDLAVLGVLDQRLRELPLASTGYDQLDQLVQLLVDPMQLVGRYWQVEGNVEVAHQAERSFLRLDRLTGNASVGQTMLLPEHAHAVEFELGAENANPADVLDVLLDGTVLQILPLAQHAARSRVVVPLQGIAPERGTVTFRLRGAGASSVVALLGDFAISELVQTKIEAVQLFYNHSIFDASDFGSDDAALAIDKQPLLPGQKAGFANYTSYSRGINGLFIDVSGAAHLPSVADFVFRVGNVGNPNAWPLAADVDSLSVRKGEGFNGADRVMITWPDGAIRNQWLAIEVKASLGLGDSQWYFYGNAVGESGDLADTAIVNASDEVGARTHPRSFLNPAAIDDRYDFNRDGLVNATDQILARTNATTLATSLTLISVPAATRPATVVESPVALEEEAALGLAINSPYNAATEERRWLPMAHPQAAEIGLAIRELSEAELPLERECQRLWRAQLNDESQQETHDDLFHQIAAELIESGHLAL